jgi:hypothetical protein
MNLPDWQHAKIRKHLAIGNINTSNLNTSTHHCHFFVSVASVLQKTFYLCLNMKTSTINIAIMIRLHQNVKWKLCARETTMFVR